MTVFAKNTLYGLEIAVKNTQDIIEQYLTWVGTNNIYNLLHRNKDEAGDTILEYWSGLGVKGREYEQAFVNDKVTSCIGFLELDRNFNTKYANVDIICTVNLERAYNQNIRDNERAYIELMTVVEKLWIVEDFKRGIEDVFSGFKTANIMYADMQPFDVFSFTVNMAFDANLPCTSL